MKCPCGFECARLKPDSSAWHRAHRACHVEVFPGLEFGTLDNLDMLVRIFEEREQREVVS